jgi:beta-lactamase class A
MDPDEIGDVVRARPGKFSIYARNLTTGKTVECDADRVMPTESAAKTFVLVHYAQLVDAGACDPAARVTLKEDDRFPGTGVLRYLDAGLEPTIEDLAWLMIIVSDNVATALLIQEIGGPAAVNETMASLGLRSAQMNEAITLEGALAGEPFATATARDLAEVYTHLDDRCRSMLFRQQNLIGLPRRLPHSADASDVGIEMPVRVFNKTGNGMGTFVDSGLFETQAATWIVAAMAAEQTDFANRADDIAPMTFAEIGETLFSAWG